MDKSICIITGCAFVNVHDETWIWGDLHLLANILIFNANGGEWKPCPMIEENKAVTCPIFFEKRKIIVFPLELTQFNEPANSFLNEHMNKDEPRIIVPQAGLIQ